ncbi:MAG: tetratricopeptide repeat protein [Pirellulales bacterium]|nr:tetratricopeptide repeat protein [Pirellulales bacterium]
MNVRRLLFAAPWGGVCCLLPIAMARGDAPREGGALAGLYQAIANERYVEAKQCADGILRQGSPDDRTKATLYYGRVLLGLGQHREVQQYLAMMGRQTLDDEGRQRMQVYESWLGALGPKPEAALARLEAIAQSAAPLESTAEAADALAIVHLQRGEPEKAQKAVETGLAFLEYRKLKTPYIETLLRGRLGGGAQRLFETAEKLRNDGKLVDAGRVFSQVCQLCPQSPWAHLAGYRVGQCLSDLGRFDAAEAHFAAFVGPMPSGPWRGQACVALVDLAFEQRRDLAAAARHAQSATDALDKGVAKDAKDSWDKAALEIRVRQGVVSLVQGHRDRAAKAFEAARAVAPGGSTRLVLGLERLRQLASDSSPLLPAELAEGDASEIAALSAGRLYNLLSHHERAVAVLEPLLTGKIRSPSRPHRAMAALELARARTASGKKADAAVFYQRSLKEDPAARWHDETLRELALLTERIAEDQILAGWTKRAAASVETTGRVSGALDSNGGRPKAPAPAPAEHDVIWDVAVVRSAALPHWLRLTDQFPRSPRLPEALYHAGKLLAEGGQPAPDKAVAAFERLVERYPNSPWTGDAHVWLFDVKLEHQLDLDAAEAHADRAIRWLERLDEAATAKDLARLGDDAPAGLRTVRQVKYDVYLRAGLLQYLRQKPKQAAECFAKAKPFTPPRDFVVVQGTIPTGIERLIAAVESGEPLTPPCVLEGDPTAKLCLMLADVYHEAEQWEKSFTLCNRLLHGAAPRATSEQRSWAFFRRGRNYYCFEFESGGQRRGGVQDLGADDAGNPRALHFDPVASLNDYVASVKLAPQAEWADNAMFLAGNILWNHQRNADAAIAVWQRLLRVYPKSEEADRSAYFIGVAYQWSGDPVNAERAYEDFVKTRPSSAFASEARERLVEAREKRRQQEEREPPPKGKSKDVSPKSTR